MTNEWVRDQNPLKESLVPHWYALYTRSHCEQLVYSQLSAKGFQVFLPKLTVRPHRNRRQSVTSIPMFPSYLFLQHVMDKESYLQVNKVRGLVRILGERWDKLAVVPDAEIDALHKAIDLRVPILAHPYLTKGQRVQITYGPLAGVEGIFIRSNNIRDVVVLSIDLLRRSIAVEVDSSLVDAS